MISIARPIIGEEERANVLEVLDSGQLAQGPKVRQFEAQFASYCGAEYGIATSSGTAALQVALLAHGVGADDEVITSPFSFIASANSILSVGARPVFTDIEADYFTLDPQGVAQSITAKTRAILPVHLYGQLCHMNKLDKLAREHNLIIIQDACQAHGAQLNGRPVGKFGTACFSFYPTKNITTSEGGMIITNDHEVAERARLIRNHGSSQRYVHETFGYNLRMTDLEAAIGLAQLPKLSNWNTRRGSNAAYLTENLDHVGGISPPKIRPGGTHVFHQYTIRTEKRDQLINSLKTNDIGFGIYYPIPIHQQPLYRQLGFQDSLPISEAACQEVLSLPIHPRLSQDDLNQIVRTVIDA